MRLESAPVLKERKASPMWAEHISPPEIIYTGARDAGLPDDRLQIHGIEELPEEVIEVTIPITGVELESRVRIGEATFLPHFRGVASIAGAEVPEPLANPVQATPVHAVFISRAALLRDAEKQALEELDVVLGWLRVYAHYGLLWRPSGHAQSFSRGRALSHPQRGEVVVVRAWGAETRSLPRAGMIPK
jgi:hypothetical protein